jgi:hypothetical protein
MTLPNTVMGTLPRLSRCWRTGWRARAFFALCLSFALGLNAAHAQGLGIDVIGDEASDFGLMIAEWMNSETNGPMAPGLIDEGMAHIDPVLLKLEKNAQRALLIPAAEGSTP